MQFKPVWLNLVCWYKRGIDLSWKKKKSNSKMLKPILTLIMNPGITVVNPKTNLPFEKQKKLVLWIWRYQQRGLQWNIFLCSGIVQNCISAPFVLQFSRLRMNSIFLKNVHYLREARFQFSSPPPQPLELRAQGLLWSKDGIHTLRFYGKNSIHADTE